jgi:hypothetical protein
MTPEIKISDEMVQVYRDGWNEPPIPTPPAERVRAGLAAVLAGCEVPSGGEEQYRIVWSGQEGTYVDGEIDDLQDGLDHLAIIRGLSFVKEAHLERRILTDWSPVVSDNSEKGPGDG